MKKLMTTLRDALIGLILFLIAMFLVSCTPPPTAGVFDPNLSAVQAELTAQAAANQAQLYSAMATGTAQAPIVHITETAAALSFINTQLATDRTSTAIAWTPTASPLPTITMTPTPNVEATGTFSAMFAIQTQTVLQTQRAEINNNARAIFFTMVGVALMFVGIAYAYTHIKRLSITPQTVDERGRIIPVVNVLEGTIVDIERSTTGFVDMSKKFLKSLPAITAERQAEVTALSQRVDLSTRAKLPVSLLKKIDELENPERPALPAPEDEDPILIDYPLPEWSDWMQKWKPGHLALGINEHGLLQVDPEHNAHFLFAGTTGSWKTRGGVRVLVTCALASGWQVIIAGKQLDYKVFENHPNAYLVPFSLLTDPTRAIDLLRSVYGEIERRDRMMSRSNYGLWRETGQSRTMVVVDEFSNLADALEDIDRSRREELWRWARMDTAEARKYGIHMVYALQDPTAKSIDLRIRRNTTPVMFRVKDAASSRTLLNVGGAEMLSVRHFLANIVRLERGVAFAPSDPDILQILHDHPARTEEPPSWLEGVLVQDPELQDGKRDLIEGPTELHALPEDVKSAPENLKEFLAGLDDQQAKIIDLYVEGKSNRKIEQEVFGSTGGAAYTTVSKLINQYKKFSQATTTTAAGKMPPAEPIPA